MEEGWNHTNASATTFLRPNGNFLRLGFLHWDTGDIDFGFVR